MAIVSPSAPQIYRRNDALLEKASTYKALARSQEVSYVISVFGTFEADVELSEIRKCLFEEEKGLFDLYPEMSGLLYFTEASGNYYFSYIQNPDALRAIDLPQGVF